MRIRCGTWVDVCTTSCAARWSHQASTPLPSIGCITWRAQDNASSTLTGAAAIDRARCRCRNRFAGTGCRPSARAAGPRRVRGRRCRRRWRAVRRSSISTSSVRSSAAARFGATHSAIGSPTNRTREPAKRVLRKLVAGQGGTRDHRRNAGQVIEEQHIVLIALAASRGEGCAHGRAGCAGRRPPADPACGCQRRNNRARAGAANLPCGARWRQCRSCGRQCQDLAGRS